MNLTRLSVLTLIVFFATFGIYSQEISPPFYTTELIQTKTIRIEYKDFGGEGIPIIVVQGVHNFFEIPDEEPFWSNFFSQFTQVGHVYAVIKRGFGQSQKTSRGYDVSTQADDILQFMNAMNISKAILVGRTIAAQEMLHLAQYDGDRVQGLVFIDLIAYTPLYPSEDLNTFNKYYNYAASDLGVDPEKFFKQRTGYIPEIISNTSLRIYIPAIWFHNDMINGTGVVLNRLNRISRLAQYDWGQDPVKKKFFQNLYQDSVRLEKMKEIARSHNPNPQVLHAMKRAFGNNLTILKDEDAPYQTIEDLYHNHYTPKILEFISLVSE